MRVLDLMRGGWLDRAGCLVRLAADGGAGGGDGRNGQDGQGGGAGGGGGQGGAGGGGGQQGGEDVAGLKSALEKERATRKALAEEVKAMRSTLDEAGKGAKTLEELQGKLGEASKRLAEYEARDARGAALEAAVEAAAKEGLVVDVARARRYVERVGGEPGVVAKEAVELFGVKGQEKKKEGADGDGGGRRAFEGQPGDEGKRKAAAVTDPGELVRLYRENPAAYAEAVAARRAANPFFGGG